MGVSGKGDNGGRRNFCTLKSTGLYTVHTDLYRSEKGEEKGKETDSTREKFR